MGRLFRHLREEKGYTYSVSQRLFGDAVSGGAWTASTSVRTEVTEPASDRSPRRGWPSCATRRFPRPSSPTSSVRFVGSFALALENPQQVLGYYIDNWHVQAPR